MELSRVLSRVMALSGLPAILATATHENPVQQCELCRKERRVTERLCASCVDAVNRASTALTAGIEEAVRKAELAKQPRRASAGRAVQ
jgi:hypothetical protein